MLLLPTQKIELHNIIKNSWLDSSLFTFEELEDLDDNSEWHTNIIHASGYYFRIYRWSPYIDRATWKLKITKCKYTPGKINLKEDTYITYFKDIKTYFTLWLKNLDRELFWIKQWNDILWNKDSIELVFKNQNLQFNESEKENIKERLYETKNILEESNKYVPNELELINQKLDNLIIKMDDLNKFDWKTYFLWTITSIILQCAFWPESAMLLWNTLQQQFSNKIIS